MALIQNDLNGSGPFYGQLDIWFSGVQSGNSSRFDWVVYIGCYNNGWGTWSGDTQYWSANIAGVGYSGGFTLDFRPSGSSGRRYAIASGSTWVGHDGNGYRPGFDNGYSIDTNHTSVGDGGGWGAWVDAPRIPRAPSKPAAPVIWSATPNTITYGFYNSPDNGGSAEQYMNHQIAIDTGFTQELQNWQDGSSPAVAGGLRPGTLYWIRYNSHNAYGDSPWSDAVSFRTMSGVYRWTGAAWLGEEARYWDGDSWEIPDFMVRNPANDAWVLAS